MQTQKTDLGSTLIKRKVVAQYFPEECLFFSAAGYAASFPRSVSHCNTLFVLMPK